MHNEPPLRVWQRDFVEKFLSHSQRKSLLVAPVGTGKAMTAVAAARSLLQNGAVDATLFISNRAMLQQQWQQLAMQAGIELADSLELYTDQKGAVATARSLTKELDAHVDAMLSTRRWFIVADEFEQRSAELTSTVEYLLAANAKSRALLLANGVPQNSDLSVDYSFSSELVFGREQLHALATETTIARFSPSFSLIRQMGTSIAAIDQFSWRQFEKLIATLHEHDGYVVELMRGTKDGGVDVIATKDLGPTGYFKALWQAKRKRVDRKVQLSVVRELADTRLEFGASKGIIVTSSYLTRGALRRIERDKYILGKVDRDDLEEWIKQTLLRSR